VSLTPKALQDLLDELEASRASRKRAWENLQEIRWVLKDAAGVELPAPARKTIDLEGRIVKDGVGKTVKDRHLALNELVKAIREFRKFTDQPLTLRGSEYAQFRNILREKCANIGMDQGHGHTARIISKARGPDLYPTAGADFPEKCDRGFFKGNRKHPVPGKARTANVTIST
jgi:hypothetical protein